MLNTGFRFLQSKLKRRRASARVHVDASPVGESNDIPASIPVLKRPEDLPPYELIISGADDSQKNDAFPFYVFAAELASRVCVIKTAGQKAAIIASTELYGSDVAKTVFPAIREHFSPALEVRTTYWATTDLVAELSQLSKHAKQAQRDVSKDSENRKRFMSILEAALEERATDIHIEVRRNNAQVRFTVDTELYPMRTSSGGQMMPQIAVDVISSAFTLMLDDHSNSAAHYNPREQYNCTITLPDVGGQSVRLRMQSNPTNGGPNLIARVLPHGAYAPSPTFAELGYSPDQDSLLLESLAVRKGNIYWSGIPNSGKTTALKAGLEAIPNRERLKIVTVEDPVEYELPFVCHATVQRDLQSAEGLKKYAEALESWLRGNVHVMSFGEIRDRASGSVSLNSALVGVLGLLTVHTHSALGIFDRLTDPSIGSSLHILTAPEIVSLLINQELVPLLCTHCRVPFDQLSLPSRDRWRRIGDQFNVDIAKTFYRSTETSCPHCRGRGVKGMTLVAEMIKPDREFLEHIRKGDEFRAADVWLSRSDGKFDSPNMTGKPRFAHAFYKALQGQIDPHVIEKFGIYDAIRRQQKQRGKVA